MTINPTNLGRVLFASSCFVGAGALVLMGVASVAQVIKR